MSDSDGSAGSNGPLLDTGERDDSGPAGLVGVADGADGGVSGGAEDSGGGAEDSKVIDDSDDIDEEEAGGAEAVDPRSYNGVRSSKVVVVVWAGVVRAVVVWAVDVAAATPRPSSRGITGKSSSDSSESFDSSSSCRSMRRSASASGVGAGSGEGSGAGSAAGVEPAEPLGAQPVELVVG